MATSSVTAQKKMDGIYRYQRLIYDLTRAYYLLGRDRLINSLDVPEGGTVLEIGCGTGRNLIHARKRYPSARFFGVDVSSEMLKTAERSIGGNGLSKQISVAHGDGTNFDPYATFAISHFDRVFISYSLSMIPSWRKLVHHAVGLLATVENGAGGTLHIVDFGEFSTYPVIFKRAQFAWLDRFHVRPIPDFKNEIKGIGQEHFLSSEVEPYLGGYAVLAHLTR